MPVSASTLPQRNFRIYDGTTPTPFYVEAFQFTNRPVIPLKAPTATTGIQMDSGAMTNFAATFVEDDSVSHQPMDITFSILHMSEYLELIKAIGDPLETGTWTVGGDTWTGLAVSALGTRKNSNGDDIACLVPAVSHLQSHMVTLVEKIAARDDAVGGSDFYAQAKGVVITMMEHAEEGQLLTFSCTGQIWGAVGQIAGWPAGNESTPS